jgi:hypothetical protein
VAIRVFSGAFSLYEMHIEVVILGIVSLMAVMAVARRGRESHCPLPSPFGTSPTLTASSGGFGLCLFGRFRAGWVLMGLSPVARGIGLAG